MLKTKTNKIKNSLSPLIKKEIIEKLMPLEPVKIILFGSYACGAPTDGSDLDIIIIQNDYKNKWDEIKKARNFLKPINMPKDILLEKEDFFNKHISDDWINTAWYDANKYGEVLYEKR